MLGGINAAKRVGMPLHSDTDLRILGSDAPMTAFLNQSNYSTTQALDQSLMTLDRTTSFIGV